MAIINSSGETLEVGSPYISPRGMPAEYARAGIEVDRPRIGAYTGNWATASGTRAWVDGQIVGTAMWVPRPCTIYGTVHYQGSLPSSIVLDENNKMGLYSSDGTTLTRVAESPSGVGVAEIMYGAGSSNQWRYMFFTQPYVVAAPTLLWVVAVSNWSFLSGSNTAYSTGSAMLSAAASNPLGAAGVSRFWTMSAQTDLPSTQLWSGVTAATSGLFCFALI